MLAPTLVARIQKSLDLACQAMRGLIDHQQPHATELAGRRVEGKGATCYMSMSIGSMHVLKKIRACGAQLLEITPTASQPISNIS